MSGWTVVRWTGSLGLAAIVMQLLGFIALSFITAQAGAPPSFSDAPKVLAFLKNGHGAYTTALLLYFVGFALFLGFLGGLRAVAAAAAPDHEWLATTTFGAGVAVVVIVYVSLGLNLAVLAMAVSSTADPVLVRGLFETSGVVGAAPALVPAAFFLGAAGSLGAATKILPRWLALAGWIGSVLVLITALSAYAGSDPTAFWSADGTVTVVAIQLPLFVWTLGASVVFLRQKGAVARIYK